MHAKNSLSHQLTAQLHIKKQQKIR